MDREIQRQPGVDPLRIVVGAERPELRHRMLLNFQAEADGILSFRIHKK